MSRFTKIAVAVLLIAVMISPEVWSAARWQKKLKLNGYYYTTTTNYTIRFGVDSMFKRSSFSSSWVTQIIAKYEADDDGTTGLDINDNSKLILAETFVKNLSPFSYVQLYIAASDYTLDGNVGSETNITIKKSYSRFFTGGIGFAMEKQLNPDGEPVFSVLITGDYKRSLGYRTKLTFSPKINVAENNIVVRPDLNLTYKFGNKISFVFKAEPRYDTATSAFSGNTELDFVYDVFTY